MEKTFGKQKQMSLNKYWNSHKFTFLVCASVIIIFYLWWHKDSTDSGRCSTQVVFNASKTFRKRPVAVVESKGQRECRRVLESIFNKPFPEVRPTFLLNQVTGKCLEIDCFNAEMKLGCEYDGQQHYRFVKKWHDNHDAFRNQQYRDVMKYEKCKEHGIRMIRVPYTVAHKDIEGFIRKALREFGYDV
jgi:hypothetical protein